MTPQLRPSLLKAIEDLKSEVVQMADIALHQIADAFDAFKRNDVDKAKSIMTKDDQIDKLEEDIAKNALRVIWKEQPMAHDLRLVTGILKLITDIERIGDHASDIAELTLHLNHFHNKRVLPLSTKMSEAAYQMVLESINAFVRLDKAAAAKVITMDDEVDELFARIMKNIAQELKDDKIDHEYALSILMVVKYIERIGDHAVNLAEWIIFMITGEHKDTPLF